MKNKYLTSKCVAFQYPHPIHISSKKSKENENKLKKQGKIEIKMSLPR